MSNDPPAQFATPGRQQAPINAAPCAMVFFGANGDMTRRLLIPALYHLSRTSLLPGNFALINTNTHGMTPMALNVWLHISHPTMPNLLIHPDRIPDFAVYLGSLKKKPN